MLSLRPPAATMFARMDADDIAHPAALLPADQVPRCRLAVRCGRLQNFGDRCGWTPLGLLDNPPGHEEIEAQLLLGNGGAICHPAVMIRREALSRVNGYDHRFQFVEDLDLFLKLGAIGRLANLPEVLMKYRFHLGSTNVLKQTQQMQIVSDVLAEAYHRRGLVVTPEPVARRPATLLELQAMPARKAVASRYYRTAIKHATCCLLVRPYKLAWWRLFAAALRGLLFRSQARAGQSVW